MMAATYFSYHIDAEDEVFGNDRKFNWSKHNNTLSIWINVRERDSLHGSDDITISGTPEQLASIISGLQAALDGATAKHIPVTEATEVPNVAATA